MAKVLVCCLSALFLLLCLSDFARSDHGHSHDHHGHSHDHHEHSHDHHGHSHDHHGHSHDHHGHSHGDSDEDHHFHESANERPASFKYSREANIKHRPETPSVDNLKEAVKPPKPKEAEFNLWLTAVGSTVLISLAPIVILFIIPLDKSPSNENFLKVLLSFASGGLLGDAFLHLIPHALSAEQDSSHSHSHSHSPGESHSHNMGVGLWILSGIVVFLAVEKFVRIVKGKHGHSHSHSTPKKEEQHGDNATKKTKEIKVKPNKEKKEVESSDIKVSAYLNLAADFTHNFTDGLAIGASYLVGKNIGIVTTLTILLHEVPHEIGDFAILIQSGCSKKKAMFLQLVTAAGAITGTICSLMAEGAGELATSWILPFTAGGFIYIATVSVIPELLGDSKLTQSLKEIFAMLVGISMMILIAYIE